MAATSRAHQHGDDSLYVLTAPTGCRAFCLLHLHLPCQPTRDRHGLQHYSAHAPRYLTYSEGTMQRSTQLGHHIRAAFFTTACHPPATLWSTKMTVTIVSQDLHPSIAAAPGLSRIFLTRTGSMSTSNHPGLPAQIASPTSASTHCVQMGRSDTSHRASEEGDRRLPQHCVPLAQKIKRPC
jgi:hypothetical protein